MCESWRAQPQPLTSTSSFFESFQLGVKMGCANSLTYVYENHSKRLLVICTPHFYTQLASKQITRHHSSILPHLAHLPFGTGRCAAQMTPTRYAKEWMEGGPVGALREIQ